MKGKVTDKNIRFLEGGGEMGELTRKKDWSKTAVGNPESWPQSLRTTLSIILHSKFPMFLWWGPELTCFYNDAYRPSLGNNGKHPSILGEKAEEAWTEIWHIIKPLIDQVLTGGSTWSEDQLIPIFRNGKIEDVYWTFSYSPVTDESGDIAGVLVTCTETTEKINTFKRLEESNKKYFNNIMQAPAAMCVFRGKDHVVEIANQKVLEMWGKPAEAVMNKPIFEGLPESKGQGLEDLLDHVYNTGEKYVANERPVNLPRNGKIETVYVNFAWEALKELDGTITGVVGVATEVTSEVEARIKVEDSEKRFRETVKQAPLGITIFRGPDFIVEMANETYLQIVDRKESEFIGRSLFDSLPEVKEVVGPLLTKVFNTGIPFHGTEFPAILNRYGKKELSYFNMVYHALKEDSGEISGIIVVATDVTESVQAKHSLAESEKQFRNLIMQSPIPMTVFRGEDYIIEMANKEILENIWRRKESEVIGQKLLDVFPELKEQKYLGHLHQVYTTGKPYKETESIVYVEGDDGVRKFYLDYEYSPLFDTNNAVSGIMITVNDITEKVEARKIVEESEVRFRNIADSAPVMIWMSGTDKLCYFFNTEWLNFRGRTMEQESGNGWAEGVHPEDLQYCMNRYLKAFDKREKFYLEYRLKRHDGEYRWTSDSGVPRFSTDGVFEGYIGASMDIHDRIVSQENMYENEERLRLATEATELSTWDLDVQTREIIHSPRLAEIFGHNPIKKLLHSEMRNQIHAEDKKIVEDAFEAALRTGIYKYKARVVKPDNTISWISTQGKVFYDEKNKAVKLIGTLRDITKERRSQQKLEEREQKFRLLADSMPQFVWTGDAEGNLNYFNQSVYNYSGLTPEEIDKDGWIQIVHPDDKEENIKEWIKSVESGNDFLFEHRFRRHDGEYHWQLSRAIAQRDAAGNIQMWVGTSTDIQDQKTFTTELEAQVDKRTRELKKLNEALIVSEERYHMMVEEVQDYAILYLNREGIVENWNKGAERIKGYKSKEIIGKNFSIFYTEQDKENNLPQKLLDRAVSTGKALQEGWRVRKDKTLFWASVVITAIHNDKGTVIGFSKVTHDLTDKKEADNKIKENASQLQEKNQELEKMNVELQSFAYVSSHDLQEPLRKIQIFATRILEKEHQKLSEEGKDYFSRMQKAANRMQTLIEDLLMYSRTNNTEKVFKKTELNTIVNDVKSDLKEMLVQKNAIVEANTLCKVNIIPFQFRQLLNNLISNSIKFSVPERQLVVQVKCEILTGDQLKIESFSPEKKYCHLSVADNGIGFDPQYKDRIFEVFQRLHGKEEYSGTGIGLAIVKKIVENHSGVITATGELNKGATFDIYFPA